MNSSSKLNRSSTRLVCVCVRVSKHVCTYKHIRICAYTYKWVPAVLSRSPALRSAFTLLRLPFCPLFCLSLHALPLSAPSASPTLTLHFRHMHVQLVLIVASLSCVVVVALFALFFALSRFYFVLLN